MADKYKTVVASFVGAGGLPLVGGITNASVTEGDSGTKNLSFTVVLSTLANGNVNVDYATSDGSPAQGSATAGSDYVANTNTLTIPAGSLLGTVDIIINGDTNAESDETLTLILSDPSGNAVLDIPTSVATGTILNDDAPSFYLTIPVPANVQPMHQMVWAARKRVILLRTPNPAVMPMVPVTATPMVVWVSVSPNWV